MALSRDKQLLVGGVVLVGVGFLAFRQFQVDAKKGTLAEVSAPLPDIKGADDVDKISITNADKGDIVLEKKGDKWVLTKPVEAPANEQNVKSMLDNMKELKAKELVTQNADDAIKKEYHFDPSHVVHVVAWKGAEKKMDDLFGKSGARGQMVMVNGQPNIYAASGYSSYLYAREPKGFRESEIFKFDDANATNMTINSAAGSFVFAKTDKWTGTFKGHPIANLDETKVQDALRTFKSLTAEDFGDGKTPADTGLDKPESTVTISLKDNGGKFTLLVGKVSTGTAHYAQKEGNPTIYTIGSYASEWAIPSESKFQKPLDAGVKDAASAPAASGAPRMGMMPPGHPTIPH